MSISNIVNKIKMKDQPNDFIYWQTQSYQARIDPLEQIR